MAERDIFRPPSPYRRWLVYGVLLAGVLFVAKAMVEAALRPRFARRLGLEDCMRDGGRLCRGDEVYLDGAYVPNSISKGAGCPWRLELQVPNAEPPEKLAVCLNSELIPAPLFPESCRDSRMSRVLANGYYSLQAKGRLRGSVFYADQLAGGDCDSRYYAWKYGRAAIE